jgi:hypothetical protein
MTLARSRFNLRLTCPELAPLRFLSRVPRRNPPPGSLEPLRLLCPAAGPVGISRQCRLCWPASQLSFPALSCTARSGSPSPTARPPDAFSAPSSSCSRCGFWPAFLRTAQPKLGHRPLRRLRAGNRGRATAIYACSGTLGFRCADSALRLLRRHLRPAGGHRRALRRRSSSCSFSPSASRPATWWPSTRWSPSPCSSASSECTPLPSWAERWPACSTSAWPRAAAFPSAFSETLVRPAQPLLPLEAPPRRPQVRGLHALQGRTVRFDGYGRRSTTTPTTRSAGTEAAALSAHSARPFR